MQALVQKGCDFSSILQNRAPRFSLNYNLLFSVQTKRGSCITTTDVSKYEEVFWYLISSLRIARSNANTIFATELTILAHSFFIIPFSEKQAIGQRCCFEINILKNEDMFHLKIVCRTFFCAYKSQSLLFDANIFHSRRTRGVRSRRGQKI